MSERRDGQRGATAVEFALTLPLFLALIFFAIDGGRLVTARWMVSAAAVSAARVASVRATTTLAPVTAAANKAASTITLSSVAVTVGATPVTTDTAFATAKGTAGTTVTVTVQHSFTPVVGSIFGFAGLGSKTLQGRSRVAVE